MEKAERGNTPLDSLSLLVDQIEVLLAVSSLTGSKTHYNDLEQQLGSDPLFPLKNDRLCDTNLKCLRGPGQWIPLIKIDSLHNLVPHKA